MTHESPSPDITQQRAVHRLATRGQSVPGYDHLDDLRLALDRLERQLPTIDRWGRDLHGVFNRGSKVLVAGNGGSAALAAHLTGELLGRYRDERPPLPAVWIGADQAATTAIVNDYGSRDAFARQVRAHARRGDVVILLSTSGRSENIVAAAEAALRCSAECWALTGPTPNPVALLCERVLDSVGGTATVQEIHQVQVHLLCAALDTAFSVATGSP